MKIRAATRGSALARWQTDHVAALLRAVDPSIEVESVIVSTSGDRQLTTPIAELGGKGVFVKEVQAAVLDGRADIAVHSAKDMPSSVPDGLVLAGVPARGDVRDAVVGAPLDSLPSGATVGTGAPRRRAQLAAHRPDLVFGEIRGNIATRLSKASDFDAIVLAVAGLERLDLADQIAERIPTEVMVPQAGQGALAIECRDGDAALLSALAAIEDPDTRLAVDAERSFLATLGGDCRMPAGAFAVVSGREITMHAVLAASTDGAIERLRITGRDALGIGREAASRLLAAHDVEPASVRQTDTVG